MIDKKLEKNLYDIFVKKFGVEADRQFFDLKKTNKDFDGDFTMIVFPLAKVAKKSPVDIANILASGLADFDYVQKAEAVKGFLNITVSNKEWINFLEKYSFEELIGPGDEGVYVVEFASPNTNKPLHLGHMRNVFLGSSISEILRLKGYKVVRVNLLNDRGIHICKSMLAWKKWGNGITPEKAGKKGDHLVGDFYVLFEQNLKKEVDELMQKGLSKEEALRESRLMREAQQMLKDWEEGKEEVVELWKMMNSWVEEGFNRTFEELGIEFDQTDYESEVYKLGKKIVLENYEKGLVKKSPEGAYYIDLTDAGLDKKILLRSDGTSVYITQDIGIAVNRYERYKFDKHFYVVANEQIYHFQVLREVLKRFGYEWFDRIYHYSYGMVELPEGKMKSREGKVVDADDLIEEMYKTAEEKAKELGKLQGLSEEDKHRIIKIIGIGAVKYFILRVDPKKNMLFNPNESVDFDGNTAPFIQYTYARINSLLRKAKEQHIDFEQVDNGLQLETKEKSLIKSLFYFKYAFKEAYEKLQPSELANYAYNLAKEYNSFYQSLPVLKAEDKRRALRLKISAEVAKMIKFVLGVLGIDVPERM